MKLHFLLLMVASVGLTSTAASAADITLLNTSYDSTRELYRAYNQLFSRYWEDKTGDRVIVHQSHGGSTAQARLVIDGLPADVVTLGLTPDINTIAKYGLIHKNWQERLPGNSSPYASTVVFLVRQGNPRRIKDWGDLVAPGIQVITPNPKTSSGGRWNYLAAWGYAMRQPGGDEGKARAFVSAVYRQVPVLDSGARGATTTFVERGIGDVLLAWENEAMLAIQEFGAGKAEIVVPSMSILAEPPVAVVDKTVDARGTRAVATAYLEYLYSEAGQELAARYFFRPILKSVAERYATQFPKTTLFTVADIASDWAHAQQTHFADGGIFDRIYQPGSK